MLEHSGIIVSIAVVALVIIIVAWAIMTYMSLKKQEESASKEWDKLAKAITHRFDTLDLIQKYIKKTDGNRGLLKETNRTMNAYAQAFQTKDPEKAGKAEQLVSTRVIPGFTSYVKSQGKQELNNTKEIQASISKTNKEIKKAHKTYNEHILDYNMSLKTIPKNLIAKMMNISEREVFMGPKEANQISSDFE